MLEACARHSGVDPFTSYPIHLQGTGVAYHPVLSPSPRDAGLEALWLAASEPAQSSHDQPHEFLLHPSAVQVRLQKAMSRICSFVSHVCLFVCHQWYSHTAHSTQHTARHTNRCVLSTVCSLCCLRHMINLVAWSLCLSLSLDVCKGCAYCHVRVKSNPKSIHVYIDRPGGLG